MRVADVSNYDYNIDHQQADPDAWVQAFKDAGIEGVIIGSQNMAMARWQAAGCRDRAMPIVATYAEPDVDGAIHLARENSARTVCIVIEPGGIQDINEVRAAVAKVRAAGMLPALYGNRGDVLATTGGAAEFTAIPLWLASYYDDHRVISNVDWWPTLWGHQFTSTMFIAGKNRDVSEVFQEEDDMAIDSDTFRAFMKAYFVPDPPGTPPEARSGFADKDGKPIPPDQAVLDAIAAHLTTENAWAGGDHHHDLAAYATGPAVPGGAQ